MAKEIVLTHQVICAQQFAMQVLERVSEDAAPKVHDMIVNIEKKDHISNILVSMRVLFREELQVVSLEYDSHDGKAIDGFVTVGKTEAFHKAFPNKPKIKLEVKNGQPQYPSGHQSMF